MTIEDMRVLLSMPADSYSDAEVVAAYAAYLNGGESPPAVQAPLVTLAEAKRHLRVLSDDMDEDIGSKLDQATAIVIGYLKRPGNGWTVESVPAEVRAAILLVLGALFNDREGGDPLSPAARSLLQWLRDPTIG